MPPQPSTLNPPPLADEVPDTYLRKHDVVHCFGRMCRVAKISISNATIVSVTAMTTSDGDVISPNSPLDILGTYDPATRTVKWRGVPQASPPASQPGVSARCSANDCSTILNGLPGKVDAGNATTVDGCKRSRDGTGSRPLRAGRSSTTQTEVRLAPPFPRTNLPPMNIQTMAKVLREKADKIQEREPRLEDDMDNAELLRVLARILEGKSIVKAFGAPGDWGYSNPIGKAIATPADS